MKFIISILLIALLSYVCGVFELPWWSIAVAAFLVSMFIQQKPGRSFFSGFIALLLLWGGLAWFIDVRNEHILSSKMAEILPLQGKYILLILVTAIIGALVAGLAALSGSLIRSLKK